MLALPFLLGMALDMIGFAGNLIADRELPLFLAQPIVAANTAIPKPREKSVKWAGSCRT